ncbi:nickel pincer cofactor biosynthesis protein LarC [Pseudodesulfovibrio sp. zrk46]|uniref:nickel pincer cofactor biosynthesis protein LarC n=1 Tax=Pseudodesulfovibrio sp. zrk46 TaxID=2725288 RepID=UPI00144A00B3|nr:nickel pincer cofactor biosynthesis protein LarC [Pseudodesulfovibrio sp. zrk46]QJB56759.1 nickel pincer cofactor biosynthesis protein LarC [Pseudodesulfovibrio sp. zrk46]
MNILYYDCFSGISGDMNLAAMIELGVDPEYLRSELGKLGIDEEFSVEAAPGERKGITGTRVDVVLKGHHHGHGHDHGHGHHHHGEHRNLRDIEAIIDGSELDDAVKQTSLAIFRRVAEAEAKVHGKELYEVHFHEVGATDSIVDIVGAAICFHALEIDEVWCSPIELGGGFVQCAHGMMPVPAPATVEILKGIPTTRGAVQKETATPTGAAILAELVDRFEARPDMVVNRTGYGIGHRDTEIPNVLRVNLATVDGATEKLRTVPARLLQCNIDDMTGEMLGVVMEQLMDEGAMDVHFTPIVMKKNRPAVMLSLLCGADEEEYFKRLVFRHTTTLGIKSIPIDKTVLDISFEKLETPLGEVTMKNAILDGEVIRSKPELEDCRALAKKHGISLGEVYVQVGKARKV